MPLDTRIPLTNTAGPAIEGPLDLAAKYQQYQAGQMQNKLYQRKFQDLDEAAQNKNALQGILKNSINPTTGQIDTEKAKTALMQGGHFEEAQAIEKQGLEAQQQERLSSTAKIDDALKQMNFVAQNIQGAKTPEEYAARVQHIEKTLGKTLEPLHAPWHPGLVDELIQKATPIKDQLAAKHQELTLQLQQQNSGWAQTTGPNGMPVWTQHRQEGTPAYTPTGIGNKPLNEVQQFDLDAKKNKVQEAKNQAAINIDDSIAQLENLKTVQARTTTGPIAGSAPVAALRKLGPNAITGGEDLQRLEKGYADLAVKAIGQFKQMGVTFGALSQSEGKWIKDTQAALDTGGNINTEMLDKGIALLNKRKGSLAGAAPNEPAQPEDNGANDPFAGFTPEQKARFLQQHGGQ